MHVPMLDKELGMLVYATVSKGIGGFIRKTPEDFLVEEVLVDGSIASIPKGSSKPVLGTSLSKQSFVICILVKRCWDTFIAIKTIAKQLRIDQTRIHIAGIKDAKALTAQHIAIENVTIEDVEKVFIKDIEVRPIGYFRDALSSFYLLGNRFTIIVDATKHSKALLRVRIAETVSELEVQGGIPNFFGHQRFGTIRAITHTVGRAIVNGNLREAAMLFLAKPSLYEHPESRQARKELLESQDFAKALQAFPKQLRFERLMLHHLAKNPTDFVGAFQRLPIKLQCLFVQAFQAYLFNRFLSERLRHGLRLNAAVVGDFVVNLDRSGLPMSRTGRLITSDSLAEANESIRVGKLRVALPLVGFQQKLSNGEMGQIEAEILEEEGVDTSCFRIQKLSRLCAKGELRAMVSPVSDFKIEEICQSEGFQKAHRVKLSFRLLRGSYATMLLREVMKPQDPLKAGF